MVVRSVQTSKLDFEVLLRKVSLVRHHLRPLKQHPFAAVPCAVLKSLFKVLHFHSSLGHDDNTSENVQRWYADVNGDDDDYNNNDETI